MNELTPQLSSQKFLKPIAKLVFHSSYLHKIIKKRKRSIEDEVHTRMF